MGEIEHNVTAEELVEATELTRRGTRGVIPALVTIVGLASMGGGALVAAVFGKAGILETAIACGIAGALVGLPLVLGVTVFTVKRGRQMSIETIVRERVLQGEARRREFQTRLARALEMSEDEASAYDVIGRAMHAVAPDTPIELLLADNSHAHLEQAVSSSEFTGCSVDSPDRCVAARRAQTQVFADSEDLDACPMLRGRERGRCSGVCFPVAIMGRTVGVVHATGRVGELLDDDAIAELQTLANQAGNRVGMLRVMAESSFKRRPTA